MFNWIAIRHSHLYFQRNVQLDCDKTLKCRSKCLNISWQVWSSVSLTEKQSVNNYWERSSLLHGLRATQCETHVRVKLGGEKYAPQSNFSALISRDSDLNIWLWNVYGIKRLNALGTVKLDFIHNWDITNGRANAGSDDIMQAQILVRRESWGDKNHWREPHTC